MATKQVEFLLLIVVYLGWAAITWFHIVLPIWVLMPFGAILLAWHGSFQHEAVHGHLASQRWLNDLLVWLPLSLWLPYSIYRPSHRAHHNVEIPTDPHRAP